MNPAAPDSGPPGNEDTALAAALSKRVPMSPAVLERLRTERLAMTSGPAESNNKIVAFPSGSSAAPRVRSKTRLWQWVAAAAAVIVVEITAYQMRPSEPGKPSAIVTRSPQGTISSTQPEIAWENVPGKNYNVWILPKEGDYTTAPALFVAKGVRSPIPFSALKPGKDTPPEKRELDPDKEYRVLICYNDTGLTGPGERIAGTPVPFRISRAAEEKLPPPAR